MKKRRNLIIFFIIFIVGIGVAALYKGTFLNIDLGNIESNDCLKDKDESQRSFYVNINSKKNENSRSFDFEKFNGKWSLMQFTSDKDNEITIKDNTKISKGKFYVVVLDSDYNIVAKKNEVDENGNIEFITKKDEKYSIRIVGKNASGTFNISLSSTNDIDVSHIDFFS